MNILEINIMRIINLRFGTEQIFFFQSNILVLLIFFSKCIIYFYCVFYMFYSALISVIIITKLNIRAFLNMLLNKVIKYFINSFNISSIISSYELFSFYNYEILIIHSRAQSFFYIILL